MTSPSSADHAATGRPALDSPDTATTTAGTPLPWAVNARHAILAAVLDHPAATSIELAASTGYSSPAVQRALLELETAGLLRRETGGPGSQRRRANRWYPTASATELADPASLAAAANPNRRPATTGRTTTTLRPASHRLLAGLLDVLPAPGTPLPSDHRRRWLAAAEFALTLLYPDPPDHPGDSDHPPGDSADARAGQARPTPTPAKTPRRPRHTRPR